MALIKVLILISTLITLACGQSTTGKLDKNIYQFLKANQKTQKFIELLERTSQLANDRTIIDLLGASGNRVLPTDSSGSGRGYTVFAPVSESFNNLPQDQETLRNDLSNLVMKEIISLDQLKQMKDGKNVTSALTFGFRPRLSVRMVPNFYNRQLTRNTGSTTNNRRKRQFNPNNQFNNNQNNMNNQNNNQFNQNNMNNQNNNQFNQNTNNQFNQFDQNRQTQGSDSELNLYEQTYGDQQANYNGPQISTKLPQDELYLINSAIILDKFECTNGVIYVIDSYPQYHDGSLYMLAKGNSINGLGQNINMWINRADTSYQRGDESLKNALSAFGPNTFFVPTDASFNKFTDRQLLNNDSFLVDVVLKSHRISNQLLFDYYLDDPKADYKTDNMLPVSTKHRYVNNRVEIEVSIGHVKGKILPEFRNIYCASGIIHLVDTVLGTPTTSAYKRISENNQLSTFRQLIDASSQYRALLDKSPPLIYGNNQQNSQSFKQMTVLAPSDLALFAIKDDLLKNVTALDEFLGSHIITDGSNKIFFTDHDVSIFTSGRQYTTMNPQVSLTATVALDSDGINNNVVLSLQTNPSIRAKIVEGNDLVSNGVIHIVDKPLTLFVPMDVSQVLEKYSSLADPNKPALNQFVDALRSTGIFNDLKSPSKQYTLFIPTDDALSRYQDIMKGNDQEKKKQLIYRHICIDQNLQAKNLANNGQGQGQINNQMPNNQIQEGQLICRNALGQDLTLTKDQSLVSQGLGLASSKVINDFPGVYSSAYLLDTTLLNTNLPNLGLTGSVAYLKPSFALVSALVSFALLF